MSVLIAHPTRQHSHRLAFALHGAGLLHSYWTMLPERRGLPWVPPALDGFLPAAIHRNGLARLPVDKIHTLMGPLLFLKAGHRVRRMDAVQFGELAAWSTFDRWVAHHLPRLRPRVVVGYEMCCARTFEVARRLGISCVLDAAALAYPTQDRLLGLTEGEARTWAGKQLRQRKAKEISCADRIICVSDIARASYLAAGAEPARVTTNPVGCDTSVFAPHLQELRSGPARFVFIGMPSRRKGMDLLVDSFQRVVQANPGTEMHVVGDARSARMYFQSCPVTVHGKLPHGEISRLLQRMDCLVLPSRVESFGMVVVEALAAGVPVIVSDGVGASQAVSEGKNGWVIPAGDGQALTARMIDCCRSLERLRGMRALCTASAARYDWNHYDRRSVETILAVMDRPA